MRLVFFVVVFLKKEERLIGIYPGNEQQARSFFLFFFMERGLFLILFLIFSWKWEREKGGNQFRDPCDCYCIWFTP